MFWEYIKAMWERLSRHWFWCDVIGDVICFSALIKMGDFLSGGNVTDRTDVAKAAELYKLATFLGEPQVSLLAY